MSENDRNWCNSEFERPTRQEIVERAIANLRRDLASHWPRYWRTFDAKLNCIHGVILYGVKCVQCERDGLAANPKV